MPLATADTLDDCASRLAPACAAPHLAVELRPLFAALEAALAVGDEAASAHLIARIDAVMART